MMMSLDAACIDILRFDQDIRYVGFVDNLGRIVNERMRPGVTSHLSGFESGVSISQATKRISMRKRFEPHLGKLVYSFSLYEKVKRVSIPLVHPYSASLETEADNGNDNDDATIISPFALLLSLEIKCDHELLVLAKIIPYLRRAKLLKYGDTSPSSSPSMAA
jgi:hypothetical protein